MVAICHKHEFKLINECVGCLQADLKESRLLYRDCKAKLKQYETALKEVIKIGTILEDDTPEKPSVIYGHPTSKEWVNIFLKAKEALQNKQ